MGVIDPALIAFTSAILVGFTSHFVAEDYRRFREGKAIAAALAGELSSINSSISLLKSSLITIKQALAIEQPLAIPEFPIQSSLMYEAIADKVGLLGVNLAGEVAFLYDQIRTFHVIFHWLSKHNEKMEMHWNRAVIEQLLSIIEKNEERGRTLIEKLSLKSNRSYWSLKPIWTAVMVGITLTALSSLFGALYCNLPGT
jgi:hypothetical protein